MTAAAPFLFGKLPSHGDFVSRSMSPEVRDLWDAWASGEIEAAREKLGDGFDDAHDRILPCRFVAGPGELAPTWRAGAIAATVDSAGRRFLVVAGFEGLSAAGAGALGAALADRSEGVLRRALITPLTADEALEYLAAQGPAPGDLAAAEAMGVTTGAEGVWWRPDDASVLKGAAPPVGLVMTALNAAIPAGGPA